MPITHPVPNSPPIPVSSEATALRIERLTFEYPGGHSALRGISLVVERGEKVALVGPNGAGKSTLMLHLNGILTGSGEIHVEGCRLEKGTLRRIRGRLGMVFQNPDDQLFSPTVFDDVAFGPLHMRLPEDVVRSRVAAALAQVGMTGFEGRLSHHLSVGEKKRVSLATVLSMDPAILVLDEPTAGLDPRARRGLIDLLRTLDLTMLVSTHDMRLVAELFERMVVMDEGEIVADGETWIMMQDSALLEAHGLETP
ncbi:MAG TPA: ABC transporter ATP-binding protein [Anaerolineales bacterium]|nr:ABC transporter ATP-binding protein [Anaerolineales bacterium]